MRLEGFWTLGRREGGEEEGGSVVSHGRGGRSWVRSMMSDGDAQEWEVQKADGMEMDLPAGRRQAVISTDKKDKVSFRDLLIDGL